MLKLLFDSGATKCDVILLDEERRYVRHYSDRGINASYMADEEMDAVLGRMAAAFNDVCELGEIEFAGAGCGDTGNALRIAQMLKKHFSKQWRPDLKIVVESDLEGACRILCGAHSGMVAIIGTGASCCLYNGETIEQQVPSAGYMLGDEGSGTHLGMLFIRNFLRGELPADLAAAAGLQRTEVIRKIYRGPNPNLYFSSFAQFLNEKQHLPAIKAIIDENFSHFFTSQIAKINHFPKYSLNIMGSIGYFFRQNIQENAELYGVRIHKIAKSPLSALRGNHNLQDS